MPADGTASPLRARVHRIAGMPAYARYGRVTRVVGLVIEATGLDVGLGEVCRITPVGPGRDVLAEVVGITRRDVLLMPLEETEGLHAGCGVEPLGHAGTIQVGDALLGRILDGLGRPIDGKGPLVTSGTRSLVGTPPNPLHREVITRPLETGVRAIDGLLTIGRGQRVGVFAGSGVGKSTLLGMIARRATADVNVIALLGERGREVREFVEHALGPEGLAKSVVIVATGEQAALVRARGAFVATAIAEHFRDQGLEVLLMVDSITRVAMAWREIGLAAGEPPTTKGYPPSVFANLPRLLERAGNAAVGGITGIYTVLVDGDDFNEPVADAARSILDGHVVLTRTLADRAHYPAIDVLESKSRVRDQIIPPEQRVAATALLRTQAVYRQNEDLIKIGKIARGTNPEVDTALALHEPTLRFLQQEPTECSTYGETQAALAALGLQIGHLARRPT